jgi:tRNA1(Val) A37 N6-methylase TrmN6
MSAPPGDVSEDRLLGGRVVLRQPIEGYRVAIDPVLLAATVCAGPQDTVLDVGSGVGAASLCLAARVPGCRITGLEKQRDLVRLAADNAGLNDVAGRVAAIAGDLLAPPPRLAPGSYDHVMANPPYLDPAKATLPRGAKAISHAEGEADLAAWVRFSLAMVRPKGMMTFIHRADRLEALLAQLAGRAGELVLFPLWAGPGKPAKRVLVRARKDVAAPTRLAPGLILHEVDGRYTREAEAILRDAAPLEI